MPQKVSPPFPIVIMAHGFSATVDGMVADRYAEVFFETGCAVLLYDHRNFGRSDGQPRQEINKWVQTRGYCDAMEYAATLPEVDASRMAIWGDSASGGQVIAAAAVTGRPKAVIAQVPACGDEPPPPDPDGALFAAIKHTLLNENLQTAFPATTVGPMPVVSFNQRAIPSHLPPLTAFRWFMEYGGRFGTHWANEATYVMLDTPAPLHPGLCAPHLTASLLMVIARDDEMPGASPAIAHSTFLASPEPKRLVEIDGGHFGLLYYPGDVFTQSSHAQRDFLIEHL